MPPIRLYFVFLRVLLYTFGTGMAGVLTQASTQGTTIHRYTWMAMVLGAVATAVTEAAMVWPKDPPPPPGAHT